MCWDVWPLLYYKFTAESWTEFGEVMAMGKVDCLKRPLHDLNDVATLRCDVLLIIMHAYFILFL